MDVIVRFTHEDIFNHTNIFKNHREFIEYLFKKKGYVITKWNWERHPVTGQWQQHDDGIKFKRTDSDIALMFEVHGTVGKNIAEYRP